MRGVQKNCRTLAAASAVMALATLGGFGTTSAQEQDRSAVGSVDRLHPSVSAETLIARRDLALADPVHAGERLRTTADGRAAVRLADGALLTLGEAAVITLDSLIYEPDAADGDGAGTITVLHGAFRMVSGTLGKQGRFRVETPVATIGIRGTDFWAYQDGGALSVVLLDDGRVEIETAGGSITLDAPRDGIVITDANAPLPDAPARWSQDRIDRNVVTVAFPGE